MDEMFDNSFEDYVVYNSTLLNQLLMEVNGKYSELLM